ncbi:MAG: glycerate kinase [Verrucomicrobia bacterium]|nr:glycerate kinase [Verrucomicrobiota bacterium]
MRILIANDKFKGSLPAEKAGFHIKNSLETVFPQAVFDLCPIADGGEGTALAMTTALAGEWTFCPTQDAQGRPIQAPFGWVAASATAVMEMSAASGLAIVQDLELNPLTASTLGTGILIQSALAKGARRILIGIGGSATNDGGLGVALALGYTFKNSGQAFTPTLETVLEADRVERPAHLPAFELIVACDVDNPLLGPRGATRVYGPQKGVRDFAWFERRLEHLADLARRDLGVDPRDVPGAGAAGGLGFGLMAFLGGRLVSGFDMVATQVGLAARITAADLVITGEGRLDEQSLQGKGPVGVARLARRLGKKIVGVAGSVDDSAALRAQFDLLIPIKPATMPLAEAMRRTGELIETAVRAQAAPLRDLSS